MWDADVAGVVAVDTIEEPRRGKNKNNGVFSRAKLALIFCGD